LTIAEKNITEIIFENLHKINIEKPMLGKIQNGFDKKSFQDMKPKIKIRPSKNYLTLKKNNAEQNCSSMVSLNVESLKNSNVNINLIPIENDKEKNKEKQRERHKTENRLKLFPDNIGNEKRESNISDLNVIKYLNKNQLKRSSIEQSRENNIITDLNINIVKFPRRPAPKKNYIKKELFPISYYYMNLIFDRLIKPKNFLCLDKKYFIMYNFMVKFLDVSSHIQLLKYFLIFKDFFLSNLPSNSKIKNLLDLEKKINISDEKKMEFIENINDKDGDIFENPIF
jgi:hypothetical protein